MSAQIIIEKKNEAQLKNLGAEKWGIWTKEKSEFDWYYDSEEQCYILEGIAAVKTSSGDYEIKKGDFVTFKKGLKCRWIIKEDIKKHYNFL
ncbi:MAG TPA: cupin domain-containing protein [bacterium]|nr:cupin domain-containing protein [bacterium]HPN31026.1 cupin domain-containing protein [bacterium]